MRLRPVRLAVVVVLLLAPPGLAWNNGQSGNSNTDTAAECSNPPYATHDWIAEQALMLLPQAEREWLTPFKAVYLIGTAPDFKLIPTACQDATPGLRRPEPGPQRRVGERWLPHGEGPGRPACPRGVQQGRDCLPPGQQPCRRVPPRSDGSLHRGREPVRPQRPQRDAPQRL